MVPLARALYDAIGRKMGVELTRDYETLLHEAVAEYYADPLGFVLAMWDWPVNGEPGPDVWQEQVLKELGAAVSERGFTGVGNVLPIRLGISSGHSCWP